MRRLSPAFALLVGLALAIALAGASTAAPKQLRSFGDGDVSINGRAATLVNDPGEFSGVFLKHGSQGGKRVRAIHMSFRYSGDTAGGAPRFSIPLDTDRDGDRDGFAFVDALNCGDTGLVSTDDPDCKVFLNFSSESFDNWADLVTTHPTWRIPRRGIPFIIADQPGTYRITNIDLR